MVNMKSYLCKTPVTSDQSRELLNFQVDPQKMKLILPTNTQRKINLTGCTETPIQQETVSLQEFARFYSNSKSSLVGLFSLQGFAGNGKYYSTREPHKAKLDSKIQYSGSRGTDLVDICEH